MFCKLEVHKQTFSTNTSQTTSFLATATHPQHHLLAHASHTLHPRTATIMAGKGRGGKKDLTPAQKAAVEKRKETMARNKAARQVSGGTAEDPMARPRGAPATPPFRRLVPRDYHYIRGELDQIEADLAVATTRDQRLVGINRWNRVRILSVYAVRAQLTRFQAEVDRLRNMQQEQEAEQAQQEHEAQQDRGGSATDAQNGMVGPGFKTPKLLPKDSRKWQDRHKDSAKKSKQNSRNEPAAAAQQQGADDSPGQQPSAPTSSMVAGAIEEENNQDNNNQQQGRGGAATDPRPIRNRASAAQQGLQRPGIDGGGPVRPSQQHNNSGAAAAPSQQTGRTSAAAPPLNNNNGAQNSRPNRAQQMLEEADRRRRDSAATPERIHYDSEEEYEDPPATQDTPSGRTKGTKRPATKSGAKRKGAGGAAGTTPKKSRARGAATPAEQAIANAIVEDDESRRNDKVLWRICERCISQIDDSEYPPQRIRHASVLTSYHQTATAALAPISRKSSRTAAGVVSMATVHARMSSPGQSSRR